MLTGIQRAAKENVFSGLNNLIVCDVTNHHYSSYFDFIKDETQDILKHYGLKLNNEVKEMYDGYRIGNTEIYNPWSILCYIDSQELTSYWVNTSSNKMIRDVDEDLFTETYQNILLRPAYHDLERENSYPMFSLGMYMYLENQYEVLSNHENGKGRFNNS